MKFLAFLLFLVFLFTQYSDEILSRVAPPQNLPVGINAPFEPKQTPIPQKNIRYQDSTLNLFAEFTLEAVVLSSEQYALGKRAKISRTDLIVGWGVMSDPSVYKLLYIEQANRSADMQWIFEPPISEPELFQNSALIHIISKDNEIQSKVDSLNKGMLVTLKGYLVHVAGPGQWRWQSSTTRTDLGVGEIFYVTEVQK